MAVFYRDRTDDSAFVRRMFASLRRNVGSADVDGETLTCDVDAFTAALEAQSRNGADKPIYPARRYAACEALEHFSFDAAIDREGAVLVIDANAEPYITRYRSAEDFLAAVNEPHAHAKAARARSLTVTDPGSSALGAAAFAWGVSQSLQQAVVAVVAGRGFTGQDAWATQLILGDARQIDRLVVLGDGVVCARRAVRSLTPARRHALTMVMLGHVSDVARKWLRLLPLANAARRLRGAIPKPHATPSDAHGAVARNALTTAFASLRYTLKTPHVS